MTNNNDYRFGYVTILGKPNVGKSTLMNHLIGQKISITSHRPQTTRHRILGIHTDDNIQVVFVDTPGIHSVRKKTNRKAINRVINRTATNSIEGVDVVCLMITAKGWSDDDRLALQALKNTSLPIILLINKVDTLKEKSKVLPLIAESSALHNFTEIVPICATRGDNVQHLLEQVLPQYLPKQEAGFDESQITDRSFKFLVTELIREQLFRRLGDELPYGMAVELGRYEEIDSVQNISADIWVEKDSHKAMVIGKQGSSLKVIGSNARKGIEQLLEKKVYLELYVKVRSGWSDSVRDLSSLGYDEDHF